MYDSSEDAEFDRSMYFRDVKNELLNDIAKTKSALDLAYANFENVTDPNLIDSYIYEVNAVQIRYQFLLERAKQYELEQFVKH